MPTPLEIAQYIQHPDRALRFGAALLAGNNEEIQRLLNAPGFASVNRETLSGAEIFDAIELAEFSTLGEEMQNRVKLLIQISGQISVGPDSKAREWLLAAFGPQTTTRASLVNLVVREGSEAESVWGQPVSIQQIREAL